MDFPVGYLVGDAQCTLCAGPWSSIGPVSWYGVDVPVVVQRQVLWPTLLANAGSTVDTCSASLLGGLWKNFTYFLRECGTLILKSILRPALLWPAGEVCTVDASIAE